MKIFRSLASNKIALILSVIMGTFIIYPNIVDLLWHFPDYKMRSETVEYIIFFIYRYLFFCLLIWAMLTSNIKYFTMLVFSKRLLYTLLISVTAYQIYVLISLALSQHVDFFTGILFFQFVVACLLCTLIGHVFAMYNEQKKKEYEIEQLKIENLQSRYQALSNQINPHFFFNSLNGISALVRDEKRDQTLEYINNLSGVFRYILQSDNKGLVKLKEELDFLEAFRYIFETRYANKLTFKIDIGVSKHDLHIPVLSMMPLIENIIKHNIIDSDHLMTISIILNDKDELVISNPIYKKQDDTSGNGIGLSNLSERFMLLTNHKIRIENNDEIFSVILPLSYQTDIL